MNKRIKISMLKTEDKSYIVLKNGRKIGEFDTYNLASIKVKELRERQYKSDKGGIY